jgi:hypothetical protein
VVQAEKAVREVIFGIGAAEHVLTDDPSRSGRKSVPGDDELDVVKRSRANPLSEKSLAFAIRASAAPPTPSTKIPIGSGPNLRLNFSALSRESVLKNAPLT